MRHTTVDFIIFMVMALMVCAIAAYLGGPPWLLLAAAIETQVTVLFYGGYNEDDE